MSALFPPPLDSKSSDKRRLWAGFATGIVVDALPFLLAAIRRNGHARDGIVIATLLAFPGLTIVAGILAAIPLTRKFGLGLLLACGFSLLVLLAICGGGFFRT